MKWFVNWMDPSGFWVLGSRFSVGGDRETNYQDESNQWLCWNEQHKKKILGWECGSKNEIL